MTLQPTPPPTGKEKPSPPWSRTTKLIVGLAALFVVFLLFQRFQALVGQLIVAAMLAYIFNPLVNFVDRHTPLNRATVILISYLTVAIVIIGAIIAVGVAAYSQTLNILNEAPTILNNFIIFLQETAVEPLEFLNRGPFNFDLNQLGWEDLRAQLLGFLEPLLSGGSQAVGRFAGSTVRTIGYLFFVFIISIYVALEIPRLRGYVVRLAYQPGYQHDAEHLMGSFSAIWSAYLRGQILLGLVIGIIVWLGLAILGVQNALALGILSGLLEFIPIIGPLIGASAAFAVALFQPTNYLGLDPVNHALIVLGLMFVIQQLENNVLVPRIVGEALDLHPLLVIIGVFMGSSIAGILGAILAAPIVATVKLITLYAWRKLWDLPPFPHSDEPDPPKISFWQRTQLLLREIQRRRALNRQRPSTD